MSAIHGSERDEFEQAQALHRAVIHIQDFNHISAAMHRLNRHFYEDVVTGEPLLNVNAGEKIALMHSELSECLEGVRKNKADDHLPHRSSEEVELADLFIRAFDYAGWRKLDLAGAIRDKLAYNRTRADHTNEARRAVGGKKF